MAEIMSWHIRVEVRSRYFALVEVPFVCIQSSVAQWQLLGSPFWDELQE